MEYPLFMRYNVVTAFHDAAIYEGTCLKWLALACKERFLRKEKYRQHAAAIVSIHDLPVPEKIRRKGNAEIRVQVHEAFNSCYSML